MKNVAVTFAVLISTALFSYAFTIPDKPIGYVNDYANILSVDAKQNLENELKNFTASSSNEISVVIIPDLGGDTVENYASKLFSNWKIGNAKNDNGILLLISRDDRKFRIEVGYGLEGALPDITAKDIIDNKITPSFKQGNYDDGVIQGVKSIEDVTRGEYKATGKKSSSSINGNTIEFIIVFLIIGLQFLASILGRSKSWWAGGLIGGIGGVVMTFFGIFGITLIWGSIVTVIFILFGLLFDYFVSNSYKSAIDGGSSIPWWIGGNRGGGSSGGGSSFGGFGGGSSGGGGASGSW